MYSKALNFSISALERSPLQGWGIMFVSLPEIVVRKFYTALSLEWFNEACYIKPECFNCSFLQGGFCSSTYEPLQLSFAGELGWQISQQNS